MANRSKPQPRNEPDEIIRTFQMRLPGDHPALDDLADRYQRAKRTVYGKARLTGCSFEAFKTEICAEFALPGRLFNAIRLDLGWRLPSTASLVGDQTHSRPVIRFDQVDRSGCLSSVSKNPPMACALRLS